mgnify:CR=1 FL=1
MSSNGISQRLMVCCPVCFGMVVFTFSILLFSPLGQMGQCHYENDDIRSIGRSGSRIS